jgi:hypothetical protein
VLSTKWVYVALPFLLAIVFQFVTPIFGASAGVAGFGAACLAEPTSIGIIPTVQRRALIDQ